MFKIIGYISLICGFLVPYVSTPEVTMAWGIALQALFYAVGIYYIFKMED